MKTNSTHTAKVGHKLTTAEIKAAFTETYFPGMNPDLTAWGKECGKHLNKVVVMIPARKGSTRIKDKNIQDVCGKPLLAYTAEIATRLKGVDRVIMNTDSPQYGAIAEQYGVEVPFIRPTDLAGTTTSMSWAHYYAFLSFVAEEYPVKTIITLPPTNPFRNLAQIQALVDLTAECGFVQSCFHSQTEPNQTLCKEGSEWIQASYPTTPPTHLPIKTFGYFSGATVLNDLYRIADKYHFLTNPFELIDIDTQADLDLARFTIENELYDFGASIC